LIVFRFFGYLFLLLTVYLSIAFISYLFTWQADLDPVLRYSWQLILSNDIEVANWVGKGGAVLAHQFIYDGFGIAAFLILPMLARFGLDLSRIAVKLPFDISSKSLFPFMILLSIVFGLLMGGSTFPWGGALGDMVTSFFGGPLL